MGDLSSVRVSHAEKRSKILATKGQRVKPRRLKGFADHDPSYTQLRESIVTTLREVAHLAGFSPMQTPALEYAEVLLGLGGETDKQVFRFLDNGERDVALRFDLTVPFARYVAEHFSELVLPFKRLQVGNVWRAEKPQKGRYREFGQCDLDVIGVDSVAADAEVVACFAHVFTRLELGGVRVLLSHRQVLSGLIAEVLGAAPEDEAQVLIAVDKLDKIGAEAVTALLQQIDSVATEKAATFLELLTRRDADGHSDLEAIRRVLPPGTAGGDAVEQLGDFLQLMQSMAVPDGVQFVISLSTVRGLGYYTGLVFETLLDRLPDFGSVCSGGRYGCLVERFMSTSLSGFGGSLGLDRLVAAMQEMGKAPAAVVPQVFVALTGTQVRAYGFRVVGTLRQAGIAADIALKAQKLGQQFRYADRRGFRWVVTVGEEEAAAQVVNVKDMVAGQEAKGVALADLVSRVRG